MEETPIEIYGLYDELGRLRYIGKANLAKARLKAHMREVRRRTPLYDWIAKLKKNGLSPTMRILEITTEQDWPRTEKEHIFQARLRGEKLLNLADGGDMPLCNSGTLSKNGKESYTIFPLWKKCLRQLGRNLVQIRKTGKQSSIKLTESAIEVLAKMDDNQKSSFEKRWAKEGVQL